MWILEAFPFFFLFIFSIQSFIPFDYSTIK
uniref:Uncharacterized protein n=1 Tax=Rhizophora mucronata TaxID=61149 RepID=A0A2P2R4M4_RHIMU